MEDNNTLGLADLLKVVQGDDGELYYNNVREIHHALAFANELHQRKQISDLVNYMISNRILGMATDFHNAISEIFRSGSYELGLEACEYARGFYPYDPDILGNTLRACAGCADFATGAEILSQAAKLDKKYWNWRLFIFALDYYETFFSVAQPGAELEQAYAEAVELGKEFIEKLPYDERGYNKLAEIYLYKNDYKNAELILGQAIFGEVGKPKTHIKAPQCCVTFLDHILDNKSSSQDLERVISVCDKGIEGTTQEQPSSRIGYFTYRKALAKDALCVKDGFNSKNKVTEALLLYQNAYDMNKDIESYRKTIVERYKILYPYGDETKRKLITDNTIEMKETTKTETSEKQES